MFLLDTNVISELRAGKPTASPAVRRWAEGVPANQQYIAAVTVLELEIGVLAMERKDPRQGQQLRSWLQAVSGEVLPSGPALRRRLRPSCARQCMFLIRTARAGCHDRRDSQRTRLHGRDPQY